MALDVRKEGALLLAIDLPEAEVVFVDGDHFWRPLLPAGAEAHASALSDAGSGAVKEERQKGRWLRARDCETPIPIRARNVSRRVQFQKQ